MKRKDGYLVTGTDPIYSLIAYFMKTRNDALNMTTLRIKEAPLKEYLKSRRAQGKPVSHMSVILAAYVRCLAEFPELNRFVVNCRVYARNEICVSMVVMRPGGGDSTMTKVYFEPTDTLDQVNDKINAFLEESRNPTEEVGIDKTMAFLAKNSFISRMGVRFLTWADKHGMLPKSLIDFSPFHASLCITNLASIRTQSVYHHIYNFGTISNFLAIGLPEEQLELNSEGKPEMVRYLSMGLVMDERACPGHVYGTVFHRLRKYLSNPTLLEEPPTVVNKDA